jgi:hypothetical protein
MKLNYLVMQIFTELGEVYGSDKVSCVTFRGWRKKFLTDIKFVKDAAISDRPVIVTVKANVSKLMEIIGSDDRYTISDIARYIPSGCISFCSLL